MIHHIFYRMAQMAKPLIPAIMAMLVLLPGTAVAEVVDRVVAVVNDDIITFSELDLAGEEYLAKIRQSNPKDGLDKALNDARNILLDKLIDQHLISQQAIAAKISLSDAEFEKAYENNIKGMNLSRESLLEKLKEAGLSEENYRDNLRNQLLRDKLVLYEVRSKIIITDEMITDYYDREYSKETAGGGYYLLQMGFSFGNSEQVLQSAENKEADKVRARKKAEEARRQIVDGADFATVAREKSDLPSAADGGDLGLFQKNEMAEYMREAVVPLKPGEISPIIETPTGYQFFKLLSIKEGEIVYQAQLETVKEDIRKNIFEEKFKEEFRNWVDKIKKEAYIKKML